MWVVIVGLLLVATIGAGVAGVVADPNWLFALIPGIWLTLGIAVWRGLRLTAARRHEVMSVPDEATVRAAGAEGRISLARVLSATEAGGSFDHAPVCLLRLLVVPDGRPAYEVTIERVVTVLLAPRVQPDRVVVVVEGAKVRLLTEPPAAWAARARTDERVRTVPAP